MLVFTDPIILAITLGVIILVLIIGGIAIGVSKARKNAQEYTAAYPQPTHQQSLNITTDMMITTPIAIAANTQITLKRDYTNKYAPYLIAAYINSQLIGYIDQGISQVVAPLMDSGVPVYARAISSTANQCKMQIYT